MSNPNPVPPPISGRWKPGQSGNPGGRPKKKPITEALQRLLAKLSDEEMETLCRPTIEKFAQADMAAFKEVTDRVEGKVPTPIGGTDDLPAIKGFGWIEPKTTTASSE